MKFAPGLCKLLIALNKIYTVEAIDLIILCIMVIVTQKRLFYFISPRVRIKCNRVYTTDSPEVTRSGNPGDDSFTKLVKNNPGQIGAS